MQARRRSVQRRSLPKSLSQELVRSTTYRLPTWIGAGVPRWAISPSRPARRALPGRGGVITGVQVHGDVLGQRLEVLERVEGLGQQRVVDGVGRCRHGGDRNAGAVGELGALHPALGPVNGAAAGAVAAAGRLVV